jgi:c(7)-type cytochrome triheme protein
MRKLFPVSIILLAVASLAFAQGEAKKKTRPYEYGTLTIDNFSTKAGFAPAVFDHWVHRSKYTCKLCHVDLAFTMKRNGSGITAAENMKGAFCGACHNGTRLYGKDVIFQACTKEFTKEDVKRCERCHQTGRNPKKQQAFAAFAQDLPKARFSNGINWEKAEEMGMIKPIDFLEGISFKQDQLPVQKDFSLASKVGGMPDIIFSHKKHVVWNGCEVCHPDIFAVKKGTTKYSMTDMFEGKYCGVCHDTVAFAQIDCQRCHTKPVQ